MQTVDVREVAPRERHPMIFDCFDQLEPVLEILRADRDGGQRQ